MAIPKTYQTPHGLSDQLRNEISARGSLTLGTINPDGTPHLTLVLFAWDDSGNLLIPTPHSTRKIKNVRERNTVTALIAVASGWASCYGTAEVVEGTRAAELNQTVRERLLTDRGLETMGVFLSHHENNTIRITPTKWLSWNYDVIDTWMHDNGYDTSDDDTWWKDLST